MKKEIRDAIDAGFKIFPIVPNGKRPAICGWQQEATYDECKIMQWEKQYKGCNWGVATGQSNLLIVDIDNHGMDGLASLKDWVKSNGKLPYTLTAKTPNQGYHLYYFSDNMNLKNKVGLLKGVDIRANGGLVVIPPSIIDGRDYRWLTQTEAKEELKDIFEL